jgi:NADPH:quinone reductase-like Zn-dependent oxidoreductase
MIATSIFSEGSEALSHCTIVKQEVEIMTPGNNVASGPVLFAGGAGFVGRTAVRWFRARYPSIRVLVGGRNLQAANEIA